jgi:hypothetical protein
MVRVPLLFRGFAVLLLAASTVVGQTPEPPAEFLSLDPLGPSSPDLLRQLSADPRHPLLNLMVDGELTSFDASAAQDSSKQDSSKLKPTPQTPSTAPKAGASDGILVDGDGCQSDGCGALLGGGGMFDGCAGCSAVPNLFSSACSPPPCCCRKCLRRFGRGHCCGGGYGAGANPYLGWPTCPGWCFYGEPLVPCYDGCCRKRLFGHKHCCGGSGCGGMGMGCDGWMDGGFCGGCMPQPCCGRKRLFGHKQCCGGSGYGCGYGGMGMGYDGWMDGGFCGGCMPPPCCCRRCLRKHGCGYGYGNAGWGGCCGGMSPYGGCGYGCGKQRCGLFHRRCCQQSYPYCQAPMMMPCMGMGMGMGMGMDMGMDMGMGMGEGSFCADCTSGGSGALDGIVMDGTIN